MKLFGKTCKNFLRWLDIFGIKIEINMDKKARYNTTIGGFFTLIMALLCTLLFLEFGTDMYYHSNPTTISSTIHQKSPVRTPFSTEKYFLMFGVQAPNFVQFMDDTIYTITATNTRISKLPNGDNKSYNMQLVPCSEDLLPSQPNLHEYFMTASGSPLSTVYCIKNLENYYIEGTFAGDVYSYIDIKVKPCVNKTADSSAPICKPMEYIKKMSGYFTFMTTDYLIDPQSFESPGKAAGVDYYTPISPNIAKKTTRFIGTSRINSDDGVFFSSKNQYVYPNYNFDKETMFIGDDTKNYMMDFVIRMDQSENVYTRKYQKMQDVLADMGGFIQIIFWIIMVMTFPFRIKKYNEKMINSIYNFENDELDTADKSKKISKFQSVKILKTPDKAKSKNQDSTKSSNFKQIFVKNDLYENQFFKFLAKIKNKLPFKLTLYEFLPGFLISNPKKTPKIKRFEKAISAIQEKLDVSYILKKFYELDKLKMLILNKDQYHLFEYQPKPVILKNAKIDLGAKNFSFISYETSKDVRGKIKKMFNAYNNIKKKNELTILDQQLIDMLDDQVKEIMEVFLFCVYFEIFYK